MERLFIITGADGHLGSALVRLLRTRKVKVRGFVLPGHSPVKVPEVTYYEGDVRDKDSMRPLFENIPEETEVYVIHTAGIVDISHDVSQRVWEVNVCGTKNMLDICREYNVKRLVYVSSVHAIPEGDKSSVLTEVDHFDPAWVVGGYAKTKAEATQAVLDAAADGLNAVIVHPSGIIGPYNGKGNHLIQMVNDYLHGKLPACVNGGYDFVDVRDVALGCLLAAEKGRAGQCYILSNRHYEIREVISILRKSAGGRRIPVIPMWLAKMVAPIFEYTAKRKKKLPLYTGYSLRTLTANDKFSHDKATAELGYRPRDLIQTLKDTASWIIGSDGVLKKKLRKLKSGKKKAQPAEAAENANAAEAGNLIADEAVTGSAEQAKKSGMMKHKRAPKTKKPGRAKTRISVLPQSAM